MGTKMPADMNTLESHAHVCERSQRNMSWRRTAFPAFKFAGQVLVLSVVLAVLAQCRMARPSMELGIPSFTLHQQWSHAM